MSEEGKSEREKLAQNVFIGLLVGLFLMIFFFIGSLVLGLANL